MITGWLIVLATIVLLAPGASQMAFVLMSLSIELTGLVFVARSHVGFRVKRNGVNEIGVNQIE